MIKGDKLLKKYNEILEKVTNIIYKELYTMKHILYTVYNQKNIKTKIKSYNGKFNTNFHDNKTPKEGSQFICLSVILINSVDGQ